MLTTFWTAPGAGASVAELMSKLPAGSVPYSTVRGLMGKAGRLTALATQGNDPFQPYDVERALEALRRVAEGHE